MPVAPAFLAAGPEWSVGSIGSIGPAGAPAQPAPEAPAAGFGHSLTQAVGKLDQMQGQAAQASEALATGQATDPTQVVMTVERARLAMQLASQIRTKAVEAVNDVFHTQV